MTEVKTYIDVMNSMFNNTYEKNDKKDKMRNYFTINRRFAIKHPEQAAKMSTIGINTEHAVDSINYFLQILYKNRTPKWVYLKSLKPNISKYKYNEDSKKYFIELHEIDDKIFQNALEFEPNKILQELKLIDKYLKEINKIKSFTLDETL